MPVTMVGRKTPELTPALDAPADRLTLLSFLFATAVLFHQQQLDDWAVPSSGLLVTFAAVWLLLRPASTGRLALLVGLHAGSVLLDLPLVVNHWLLVFLAEVGAMVALSVGALRRQGWVRDRGGLYLRIAPYLRVQFVLVYLVAAFAKINADFLDADLSCGVAMIDQLLTPGPLDLRAEWLLQPVIWGTVAIELLLPVGLVWRRTRVIAVFAGVGFHTVLALVGHVPFSGFALAYYALFAPDDLLRRAREVLQRHPQIATVLDRFRRGAASRSGTASAFAVAVVVTALFQVPSLDGPLSWGLLLLFLVFTALLLGAFTACLLVRQPLLWRPAPLRLASPVWLIGPLLVALNAASPYAGGKTQTTFTMYSNLQTEGSSWNHLLVPQSVQVLDSQDHRVRILASSDARMQQAAENDRLWVWDGLRSWAQRHPDASLIYQDGTRLFEVARVGDDTRLRMGAAAEKLAHYRDVPLADENSCRTLRTDAAEQHS